MKDAIDVGSLVRFCETESPAGDLSPPTGVFVDDQLRTITFVPCGDSIGIVTAMDSVEGAVIYQVLVDEKKLWFNGDSVFPLGWVNT